MPLIDMPLDELRQYAAQQAHYLMRVQQRVRSRSPQGELGLINKLTLQHAIEGKFSALGRQGFMRDGLAATG